MGAATVAPETSGQTGGEGQLRPISIRSESEESVATLVGVADNGAEHPAPRAALFTTYKRREVRVGTLCSSIRPKRAPAIRHKIPVMWSAHFQTRTIFRHHNIDAFDTQEQLRSRHAAKGSAEPRQSICGAKVELLSFT